jgi:WD40 repeat protein
MVVGRWKKASVAGLLAMALFTSERPPVTAQEAPAPNRPESGRQLWAMVVGIERYEETLAFPRCRGAARDAASIAHWIIDTAGWGPDHVLLLTDRKPEDLGFANPDRRPEHRSPTKNALERAAREWLGSKAGPGNILVVFFAGHAVSLPSTSDDPPGRPPRDYLLPIDARESDLETTGWRLGEAIDGAAARGDASVVCLLDTSPLGRLRSPGIISRQNAHGAPGERMLEGVVRWPGVTAWLGATDKPSGETADGDGFLTRALIEGLGGRREPRNLLACLDRLRREPTLAGQGFRTAGGFGPDLALWPGHVRLARPKLEPLLQDGHTDRVTGVGFTSDGGRLFSSSMDSTVRIWRTSDAVLLRVLPAVTNGLWSLAVGADGGLLVAGGGKGDLLFYDLVRDSYKQLPGPFPHAGPANNVAVLPDGSRAVTLDLQGRCLLWDARASTVSLVARVTESGARLLAVATRPGGAAFALATPGEADHDVVRAFDSDGKLLRTQVAPGRVSALALSADGTQIVLGTEQGLVAGFDEGGKKNRPDLQLSGPVSHLSLLPMWLAAASGRSLRIVPHDGLGLGGELLLDEAIERVSFTADGRRVAAVGKFEGSVRVWEIAADGVPGRRLDLEDKVAAAGVSVGFSPRGDAVIVGNGDGRIRRWSIPEGKSEPMVSANLSRRVRHVAVASDGRALLQISAEDRSAGKALVWTFGEGRGARPILGSYYPAGGFVADSSLAMIDSRGDVCLIDRATLARQPIDFARPAAEGGKGRSRARFDSLAISPNGRQIVARSSAQALACVWTATDGQLVRTIRDIDAGMINAVSYSGDGRLLLTAGDDGLAKVWNLTRDKPIRIVGPTGPDALDRPSSVTAAIFSPVDPNLVVVGRRIVREKRTEGTIELWDATKSKPKPIDRLSGEVRALAFSSDGKFLAGGGDDLQIALFAMEDLGHRVPLGRGPNHFETINSLAFWPDGKLLVSASEDTTVRLWRNADRSLIGTFAGSPEGADWVFFTPDGMFDASPQGERRVTWRLEQERGGEGVIVKLEQLHEQRHVFNLADDVLTKLANNQPLEPAVPLPRAAPPQITLEPVTALNAKQRRVDLTIRLSEPEVTDLRLYHNDVAVQGGLKVSGRDATATVTLVSGANRIYALAGRQGSVDGRSNQLDLAYDGQTPGRTHVLALGVGKYKQQALRYAGKDAQSIAAFLGRRGIGGGTSTDEPIVLLDDAVSAESMERAFHDLLGRVRNRPEDTVVVFLAGHTEVRRELFCLLLPTAILPDGPTEVAVRGPVGDQARQHRTMLPTNDPSVMPYFMIHRNLSFLDALQRLVIIDACQAEAILDDPGVRARNRLSVRRLADKEAYKARTSYILATRRGERSTEPPELEHGLLTYILLHGMGESRLASPRDVPILEQYPTADLDHDGWIDTGELQQYVRLTVPSLVKRFPVYQPRGVARDDPKRPAQAGAPVTGDCVESRPFRLVEALSRTSGR